MTGHVISFKPNGEVTALHNDSFDLSFLGRQQIKRATDIRFDSATQTWGLWLPKPWPHVGGEFYTFNGAGGFVSYEEARKVEVEWLNTSALLGVHPTSESGLSLLAEVRRKLGV